MYIITLCKSLTSQNYSLSIPLAFLSLSGEEQPKAKAIILNIKPKITNPFNSLSSKILINSRLPK
ncbi:hypothetical protein [Mammaliicoccus vitulinus]|uniref:hypothetical protein n=1 Tax=Mammaliicoccus vitulinus TaxID=71237 RepID=UPI0013049951|nr:hypothetical protein [Mammaliicoccus vitulinus]